MTGLFLFNPFLNFAFRHTLLNSQSVEPFVDELRIIGKPFVVEGLHVEL